MSKQSRNPFGFSGPITLDNLHELFSHHQALTGGWSMEAGAGGEGGEGGGAGGTGGDAFATISSQEELDRVLGARLAREREKFADYDELKKKAAEHDKAVEASRTEAEKAVEAARGEGRSEERQRSDRLLVQAKAEVLAAQARFKAPEAVVASLQLADIKVDENGVVDTAALKVKVDEAVKSGAFVIDGATAPRPDGSQGGSGTPTTGGVDKGREMFEARRKKTT